MAKELDYKEELARVRGEWRTEPIMAFRIVFKLPQLLLAYGLVPFKVPRWRQPLVAFLGILYIILFFTSVPALFWCKLMVFGERAAATLLPALLAAPFAFLIWLWRDQDRRQEIEHKSQEVALAHRSEEQDRRGEMQLQAQGFKPVADAMVDLQKFSLFLLGKYGPSLEEEAWKIMALRIKMEINDLISERIKAVPNNKPNNVSNLPGDLQIYFQENQALDIPIWFQFFCANAVEEDPNRLFRNLPHIGFVPIRNAQKLEISQSNFEISFCKIQDSSLFTLATGSSFFATGSQFVQCHFTFASTLKSNVNFCFFQACQFESPDIANGTNAFFKRCYFKKCTFAQMGTFEFQDNFFEDCKFKGGMPSTDQGNLLINCT